VCRFRLWFVVAFVLATAVVALAMRIAVGVSWTVVVAAPLGGTFAFWHSMALHLDATGARVGRTTARWSDLTVHRTRWGESLRGSASGGGATRFSLFLPAYFADWRTGTTGDELRTRAPHLFTASDQRG
jgi:hypothetical protein